MGLLRAISAHLCPLCHTGVGSEPVTGWEIAGKILSKGQMLSKEHLLLCKVMLTASIPTVQVSTHSRVVKHHVLLRQGQMAGLLLPFVMQSCLWIRCGSW